jgi:multiple sugar transport system permease protein
MSVVHTGRGRVAKAAGPRPGVGRRNGSPWWPVLFVGPFFLGIVVFYLFPIVQTASFSFTEWGAFGDSRFVGLDNYADFLQDETVLIALGNTLTYVGIALLGVPIAVWIAALLNRPGLRFANLYRTFFFMPYLAMPVAVALVWRLMFNGDFGIINTALDAIGVAGPYWLSTPGVAIVAVSIVGLWMIVGFNIIILTAGLKAIPPELYEAAALDGAGTGTQFRRITVPLLTPSIFFVVVITVINGFQLFDLLYAIIGPDAPVMRSTQSLVYLFYNESFILNNRGYGAVIAMFILVLVAAVTALQFRLQRKWVHRG